MNSPFEKKRTQEQLSFRFFWPLDNQVSQEQLKSYQEALELDSRATNLKKKVGLLQASAPVLPGVYLTSGFREIGNTAHPPPDFLKELSTLLGRFERLTHQQLGGREAPMLLCVQSDYGGAIRNIGCCLKSLRSLVHHYGEGLAYTVYVDFLESFSTLILGAPPTDFRKTFGIESDREGGPGGLIHLKEGEFAQKIKEFQNVISQKIKREFPEQPEHQLLATLLHYSRAAKAAGGDEVFMHVQLPRSLDPKAIHGLAYTRNPFTGKKDIYGVYQGGVDPKKYPIEASENDTPEIRVYSLREKFPEVYRILKKFLPVVEASFRDVVEVEFVTDADGHVFLIGFDKGQTSTKAGIVAAVELNLEGKLSDSEAALRIKAKDIEILLHPTLDDDSRAKLQDAGSTGATAAPGTSVGHVFFKMTDAINFYRAAVKAKTDKRVILIADELLISDTPGLGVINGLITRAAGIASHAAVMARANGIPCIVGLKGLECAPDGSSVSVNGKAIQAGTLMTLEAGTIGRLYFGEGRLHNLSYQEGIIRDVSLLVGRIIKSEKVPFEVRVNINNARDAETGLSFGADGVGLCRTENMFMEAESLREIRNVIFSKDPLKCIESFKKLEEIQFEDFRKIFQVMRDRVVNIRLMDLPLHDFVPQKEADFESLCRDLSHLGHEHIRTVAEELREHNPMLGLRACRFGLINPEVYNMQIRAIVRAAYAVSGAGTPVDPGIMFPLVVTQQELWRLKTRVTEIEKEVREEMKVPLNTKIAFRVGSMIELPAAAMSADQLARIGEFFAFGTNDLTQTTLGMSRDDSAHYLPAYIEKGILTSDPFKVLAEPVKELVAMAVTRGRRVRADSSFGICGEQGGDPATLSFSLEHGLNYVSCSPFRVLPTRIALVHVALSVASPLRLKTEREKAA